VIINQNEVHPQEARFFNGGTSHVSYEDVGGLEHELKLVREMVELPLRYAEASKS
jgi:ATP-dependent 26S proteasome regulatory subunit